MHKLLLLDFDGTLCLGDDPVLSYAAEVDRLLDRRGLTGPHGETVWATVSRALQTNQLLGDHISYEPDGHPTEVPRTPTPSTGGAHPVSWPLQDGYQLTQLLARQAGLTDAETGEAFMNGRRELLRRGLDNSDLHAPSGAAELLAQVRKHAGVVLVSNSPAEEFPLWLAALGLDDAVDAVINSAAKPFGMPAALDRASDLTGSPGLGAPADAVLSVGDIWANDLAHVAASGGVTVLIDRFATGLGEPTFRVSHWDDAEAMLRQWAGLRD